MRWNDRHTLYASYLGYITQAIINNLPPLLFLTFQRTFAISIERISMLITLNFGIQILVDFFAARYVDRIGYRPCIVAAHVFSASGLIALGVLPYLLPSAYVGILIAMTLNAIGGGLIEVLISPIVEALPGDEKASAMSLLHSFYCWGHMGVVILSTVYFAAVGVEAWRVLPMLWAVLPLLNTFFFTRVPIRTLGSQEERVPVRRLLTSRVFWLLFVLMVCSGASEQGMSQWSSYFAESGLGVSKAMGDLLGPCAFALMMGLARLAYGLYGARINLRGALYASSALCMASYVISVFAPWPMLSLVGCALCGLSVGMMWPGTFSTAAQANPQGGTAMFALLALAGDLGCAGGPTLVGFVSGAAGGELKAGLLCAIVFPIGLVLALTALRRTMRRAPGADSAMEKAI